MNNDLRPLVSIVVPIYNTEKYLATCVESILQQSYDNIQVCLINDGSNDNSLSICQKYEDKDQRVTVTNKCNGGVSSARNVGIESAKGDYVAFVDSDDILKSDFVEILLKAMLSNNVDVVFSGYTLLYGKKEVIKKPRIEAGKYNAIDLRKKLIDDGTLSGILFGSVCGALYKRDIILSQNVWFDENIKVNEDGIFNLIYLKYAEKIEVLPASGYLYRQFTKREILKVPHILFDDELNKASKIITDNFSCFQDFDVQIRRRELSVAFWKAIRCRNVDNTIRSIANDLKDEFSYLPLQDYYIFLDFDHISKVKKLLAYLLSHGFYYAFACIICFLVPLFERIVKH